MAAPRLEVPSREVPLDAKRLREGLDMLDQIGQQTLSVLGPTDPSVGDADLAVALALHLAGDSAGARARAERAVAAYATVGNKASEALALQALQLTTKAAS